MARYDLGKVRPTIEVNDENQLVVDGVIVANLGSGDVKPIVNVANEEELDKLFEDVFKNGKKVDDYIVVYLESSEDDYYKQWHKSVLINSQQTTDVVEEDDNGHKTWERKLSLLFADLNITLYQTYTDDIEDDIEYYYNNEVNVINIEDRGAIIDLITSNKKPSAFYYDSGIEEGVLVYTSDATMYYDAVDNEYKIIATFNDVIYGRKFIITLSYNFETKDLTYNKETINPDIIKYSAETPFYIRPTSQQGAKVYIKRHGNFKPNLKYSSNSVYWSELTEEDFVDNVATIYIRQDWILKTGYTLFLKGDNPYYYGKTKNEYFSIDCDGDYSVGGNILSIIKENEYTTDKIGLPAYCFNRLFENSTNLLQVKDLYLENITALGYYSMEGMFIGCTRLKEGIRLDNANVGGSGSLGEYCLREMYKNSGVTKVYLPYLWMLTTGILNDWLLNVGSNGTVVRVNIIDLPNGTSGIPNGWSFIDQCDVPQNDKTYCRKNQTWVDISSFIGNVNSLKTDNNSDLVSAINELSQRLDEISEQVYGKPQ